MKRSGKSTFIVVALLIFAFAYLAFFGVNDYYGDTEKIYVKGAGDIRWGIDIQGGVEAIFTPDVTSEEFEAITSEDMANAENIIKTRLVNENITDSEVYTDNDNKQIIVRFPWQSEETNYDPVAAVKELGETAMVIFRKGQDTSGEVLLQGAADVESAEAGYVDDQEYTGYIVSLKLTTEGANKFAKATSESIGSVISIWLDDTMLSAPTVQTAITNGEAMITGMEDAEAANDLAEKINAGSLPFALAIDDTIRVINPTMGEKSLDVMLLAGVIAFGLICILMIVKYRVPGFVACIAILGQIAGVIAATSGFFSAVNSFTLTIPGIAGIILSIGMGVDSNVITAERIREELRDNKKTIDGAIDAGFSNAFSAILDGNITNVIVALILMGIFGPYNGVWAKLLWPFMWVYNHTIGLIPGLAVANTITGSIYSFGYTLLIGVIFNFIFGVGASRLMLKGISRFKFLRKPTLYGGVKNG
ncbi:MAG: SecD/SecF family protein translocase subunit [Clostridia bacterium]|nr:SecD/SecF family protein translocase subunit [Clostridia bacterium]